MLRLQKTLSTTASKLAELSSENYNTVIQMGLTKLKNKGTYDTRISVIVSAF